MRHYLLHGLTYLLALTCAALVATQVHAEDDSLEVRIGYLAWEPARGPLLSNVIPEPIDAGLRGAELAVTDSNSTGRFLKQSYALSAVRTGTPEALLTQARALHEQGLRLFVVNAPAEQVLQLADALPDSLLFNAGSR
jgi:hypothetical protein